MDPALWGLGRGPWGSPEYDSRPGVLYKNVGRVVIRPAR